MGILDKLKPSPRWKHADPEVRLEGVRELEDGTEIAILAETDPEPRVRLAAIARLSDPVALGRVLTGDSSDDARERAADRLHALATNGHEVSVALAAVHGLNDPRRLSAIARGDYGDEVRRAALDRTTDSRALGAIARHARHTSTALSALERLGDEHQDELLEVALHGDHRDVAEAAFERRVRLGADLALLRQVEAKAQQKSVAKRARATIQDVEAAEAGRVAAEQERRRRESALVADAARLADVEDVAVARAELARVREAWAALGVSDAGTLAQFEEGARAAEAAIARREQAAEEAAEAARRRAEAVATCAALCERVETIDGDDVLPQLEPIEEEWRALMPIVGNGPEADRVAERFAMAVAACRKRHELGALLAEARDKLAALVAEAEALPSDADAVAASARWHALSREARGLTAILSDASRPESELTQRLVAIGEVFEARHAEAREALARAQAELAAQLQRLEDRSKRVADAESITLREGERLMRDIVAGLDQLGRVETTREIDEAAGRLRSLQEKVAPRVRELREMDEWRRFANGQQQEKLIAMAQAILASLKADEEAGKPSDLAATARALRELHGKWQDVAEAPRHAAQRLWEEFRGATDEIRSRCAGYFAQLREARHTNLQAKAALVEEAESLAESTDWGKASARFQELQTAWQSAGPVPRDAGRELGQRFRTACNRFFARRREDLAERKKVWSDNLARKEALCARAEELADSTEWDAASSELKRLQAEWKTIGPVRRNKSEAVWHRFRTAADRFFERFHRRHELALAGKLAERDALVAEVEALAAIEAETAPEGLLDTLQGLRTAWNRSVPLPPAELKPLADRWQAAFAAIGVRWPETLKGTDMDPDVVVGKLEKLVAKVEAHLEDEKPAEAKGLSQTELLAARLRDALANNAIGGRGSDESKWRAAAEAVKDAQAAWQRLAPLAAGRTEMLDSRFTTACRRVNELARRHAGPARRPTKSKGAPKDHRGPRQAAAM
jgi:hypothetical protein